MTSGHPLNRTGSKPTSPFRFFWMKWLTGQVRCQVTGMNPTLKGASADVLRLRKRSRFSHEWRALIVRTQGVTDRSKAFRIFIGSEGYHRARLCTIPQYC